MVSILCVECELHHIGISNNSISMRPHTPLCKKKLRQKHILIIIIAIHNVKQLNNCKMAVNSERAQRNRTEAPLHYN